MVYLESNTILVENLLQLLQILDVEVLSLAMTSIETNITTPYHHIGIIEFLSSEHLEIQVGLFHYIQAHIQNM